MTLRSGLGHFLGSTIRHPLPASRNPGAFPFNHFLPDFSSMSLTILHKPSGLVNLGCSNKLPRLGGLKTTELHFSQFWGVEVQDQGASMDRFCEDPLPGGRLLTSPCVLSDGGQRGETSFRNSKKGTKSIPEVATIMTSSNLITSKRPHLIITSY